LVTLIEMFLNYKLSTGREKPGTWVTRQTSKAKQIGKKIDKGHSSGVAVAGVPKCLPHDLSHKWQRWESMGERNTPSHIVSPHLVMPR
jgi:hypothetical protein